MYLMWIFFSERGRTLYNIEQSMETSSKQKFKTKKSQYIQIVQAGTLISTVVGLF